MTKIHVACPIYLCSGDFFQVARYLIGLAKIHGKPSEVTVDGRLLRIHSSDDPVALARQLQSLCPGSHRCKLTVPFSGGEPSRE